MDILSVHTVCLSYSDTQFAFKSLLSIEVNNTKTTFSFQLQSVDFVSLVVGTLSVHLVHVVHLHHHFVLLC